MRPPHTTHTQGNEARHLKEKYEAIPILEYLAEVNRRAKEETTNDPR